MENLKQNLQRNVIAGLFYINTWLWALRSSLNINDILFANWLLVISSVLIIIYVWQKDETNFNTKEFKILKRVIALILLFANLIYMVNMEISRINILAVIIFITVIILTILYYKKYGTCYDETSNWGFPLLIDISAKGEMFSLIKKSRHIDEII